jgi:hypothetical protein
MPPSLANDLFTGAANGISAKGWCGSAPNEPSLMPRQTDGRL